jgi:hypothetical protein
MNDPLLALDFVTKHRSVADQIVNGLADDELCELVLDLLAMYRHAAKRLRSTLALVAIDAALHHVAEHHSDWNRRHAAMLILSYDMWADAPGVDSTLRVHGAAALNERLSLIEQSNSMIDVISVIPVVWRKLLPELATSIGQDLLTHMVREELDYDD